MRKPKVYLFILIIASFSLVTCDVEICDDNDNRVFFDSFQNRLKIDPGYFQMASELDTVDFNLSIGFDDFINRKRLFCGPIRYENYWTNFDNGSSLDLFLDDFLMRFILIFNENRSTYFEIREVDGEYIFYEKLSNNVLVEYSVEILPILELNGIKFNDVAKIQAIEDGQLLEELIFQRENGILTYRNFIEDYQYKQIRPE